MLIDLVLNPFGADLAELVEMAKAADEADVGAIWVTDHFSGKIVGAPWSRDPFVCLGAMAAVTTHVDLGLLVANLTNRHTVQLASAINSVQSLAPGRVRLGVGSGAVPGSRFAFEHEMIGKELAGADERRMLLSDSIRSLRDIWAGVAANTAPGVGFNDLAGIVDGAAMPQLIVGASAWSTIERAIALADGVNIRRTASLAEHLERLADADLPDGFEVSVLDVRADGDDLGDVPDDLISTIVDRYVVTVWPARDIELVAALARRAPSRTSADLR